MKKLLVILLTMLLCFSCIACDDDGPSNSATDIETLVFVRGNGRVWIDNLKAAFEAKQSEYKLNIRTSSDVQLKNSISAGPESNTIDLYFGTDPDYMSFVTNRDGNVLEELTDVLNNVAPGETKSVKDKLGSNLTKAVTVNNKCYTLPWAVGTTGLLYNNTVFAEKGYEVPRTTNELKNLVIDMQDDGYTPFVGCNNNYYKYLYYVWWAQYEGLEGYYSFYDTKASDGTYPSYDVYKQEGLSKCIEALEAIIGPDDVVLSGTMSSNALISQVYLIDPSIGGLMMPNGYWFRNEVNTDNQEILMMKVPVVSSLATKLKITEEELSTCIAKIDGETLSSQEETLVNSVGNDVLARIEEARNIVCPSFTNPCGMYIPNYASAKDGAKEFIKFMLSDEGLKIYYQSCGERMAYEFDKEENANIDKSNWSLFQKSVDKVQGAKTQYTWDIRTNPIFYKTRLNVFDNYPEASIAAASKVDRKNAKTIIDNNYDSVVNRWSIIRGQAEV